MFEYVTFTVGWEHLQDVLNARGADGWHVVSVTLTNLLGAVACRVVLERPKTMPTTARRVAPVEDALRSHRFPNGALR